MTPTKPEAQPDGNGAHIPPRREYDSAGRPGAPKSATKPEDALVLMLPDRLLRWALSFGTSNTALAYDLREAADAITTLLERESWQPIKTAPKDGTAILLAVRGRHPRRPNGHGMFTTVGRWLWSADARLPHEEYPHDGAFLELNNDWDDDWGGNIGDRLWQLLPEPPARAALTGEGEPTAP